MMYSEKINIGNGPFTDALVNFVAYKRSMGFAYVASTLRKLKGINTFFSRHGFEKGVVTEQMFDLWVTKRENESEASQKARVDLLIGFSKFLKTNDFPETYVGEPLKKLTKPRFVPYIYSRNEIAAVANTFRSMLQKEPDNYSLAGVAILFSLFYGCGLRMNEGRTLRMCDVETDTGKIRILNTKNNSNRIVIASESVRGQLEKYMNLYCIGFSKDTNLFRSRRSEVISAGRIGEIFHETCLVAGIRHRPSGYLPRIHDLRHTFCVHALESMVAKGLNLYVAAPILTAYMGHKSMRETEYYLRIVHENFSSITDKMNDYAPDIFPKVGDKGED